MEIRSLMTPDGHQLRAAVWPLPQGATPRAICLLLNGHTEFVEKYEEVAQELNARGFVVVSLDWRGQGASERRVRGNRAGHVGNFEEYDFDLAAILLQVVEPLHGEARAPLIALGHSMGGHVLLRSLHDHPRRFVCAVAVAPMLAINMGKYSPAMVHTLAVLHNLVRPSKRFVYGVEGRDPLDVTFETNVVTSDRTRFERNQNLMRAKPFLRINGPTFGWLNAAIRSMRRMQRAGYAEAIKTPVMIVAAGRDKVVRAEAVREFARRLPNAKFVDIEEAEHEVLMENDSIRARFWAEFDAFVGKYV